MSDDGPSAADGPRTDASDGSGSGDADGQSGGTPAPAGARANESVGGYRSRPNDGPEQQQGGGGGNSWRLFVRDLVTSALAVLLVGAYLFAISGVWPPLVAVESGSMEPHMHANDLVFVMEEERFPGPSAVGETGVVTAQTGVYEDYTRFDGYGDVVVYKPNGSERATPIIHRAIMYVEKDERWYDRADEEYVGGAESCDEMPNCPANNSGFITKGDANENYDQVGPDVMSPPVKPEWVIGTAQVRVPGLGWLRVRA